MRFGSSPEAPDKLEAASAAFLLPVVRPGCSIPTIYQVGTDSWLGESHNTESKYCGDNDAPLEHRSLVREQSKTNS